MWTARKQSSPFSRSSSVRMPHLSTLFRLAVARRVFLAFILPKGSVGSTGAPGQGAKHQSGASVVVELSE